MGFMSGLLRSLATIFGYVAAMGLAVALAPRLTPLLIAQFKLAPDAGLDRLRRVFLVGRHRAVARCCALPSSEMVGERISIPDRVAGALLGAARVGLLAVVWCSSSTASFRPAATRPSCKGSKWRPALSKAGQQGLQSLPPEVAATIDRIKRERGL